MFAINLRYAHWTKLVLLGHNTGIALSLGVKDMKKLHLLTILMLPSLAYAHPDHSLGVYSLAHYMTGTHLLAGLAAATVLYVAYRLIRRVLVRSE